MALGNTGITTTAVGNELGTSSRNVGALCTSSLINMWSRCKPVHINNAAPDRSGLWWRGTEGKCGLSYTQTNNYSLIPSLFTSDLKNGWTYTKPSGGANSPYRLADFMYYDHKALPPFDSFTCPAEVAKTGTLNCSMAFNVITEDKTGAGSVGLDDIGNLGDWKFGVVVTDTNGTIKGRVANGTAGMVSFSPSSLTTGSTYYVYPFIALNSMTLTLSDIANSYIPIPNVAKSVFKVVSEQQASGVSIVIYGEWTSSTSVSYTIKITNSSTSSKTFQNNIAYCRFFANDFEDSLVSGEKSSRLLTITVAAGSTYTSTGTFTGLTANQNYRLWLSIGGGNYLTQGAIMQDSSQM